MNTIDISVQAQPWSTVFAVAQHFTSDEWLLTGGLMVQAHAMLHGLPVRPTTDADFLLNILTYDRIATQMESYLATMGYRLQKDALTKYATRFENPAHDKVDILVTDYLYGKKKREGATLSGMRLCGMPGGGQAIKRSMRREPPRPYGRGFRAFRRDDCFRHGYMTSYEVMPRFRGLLHARRRSSVGRLAWPGDI